MRVGSRSAAPCRRHLRALTIHGKGFKKIPPFIFALPKLKYMFLDDTGLTTLDGIEKSQTLTDITFSHTPLAKHDGPIKVGKATGVISQVSDTGWSHVWRLPNGDIALLDHDRKGGAVKPTAGVIASLGARVAQFPVRGKPTKLGTVVVRSGSLAIMLPYTDGAFTAPERKKAFVHKNYEDEYGEYGQRLRIGRRS